MGAGPGRGAGLHRGRPASRPRRELRSAARRVGSVRCPDAQLWLSTSNSARNSSTTDSNIEFASLELQRFWGISKNDRDKSRAKFGWRWCRCRPLRPSTPAGPSGLMSLGALHAGNGGGFALHEALLRRIDGVSEHHVVQFPRLVAVRSRFEVVWCPKCRPPRRKPVKTGGCGRGGLRFGHNGACRGVLFARKPLNMRVNPLIRTSTPRCTCGRRCPRACHQVNVRVVGPMRVSSG